MTYQTSMPEGILPRTGEEIQFSAVMLPDGTLQVTRILGRKLPAEPSRPQLMDWVDKWSGTLPMDPAETRDSLRREYLDRKYGGGVSHSS